MRANLDIDLLRTFVTVVDTGSFTRTGEELGRTQSAISVQIKRLEAQLDKTLLHRAGKNFELTDDGDQLLDYARRILAINDDAVSKITASPVTGQIHLGTCEEFAEHCLSDILGPFAKSHPGVRMEIIVDKSVKLLDGLRRGQFDLALANRVPGEGAAPSIVREPLVWVAREDFSVDATASIPLVIGRTECFWRKFAIDALDAAGLDWHIVCSSQESKGLQAAVMAGLGVSAFPESSFIEGMKIVGPDDDFPLLPDAEVALFTRGDEKSAALETFENYVLDYAENRPAAVVP
ncbi:MAG: LysR substrate-binding domain-containing protein [Alphaproteobacteria bacterium]